MSERQFLLSGLWRALGLAGLGVVPVPAIAEASASDIHIAVPSGQPVTWIDTIQTAPGPEGLTIRFRFLAPAIARDGGTITVEQAQDDMLYLCETFALPRVPNQGPVPEQVIISLSDRVIPFGEADEEATQYFEAYAPDEEACVWEGF